MKDKQIVLNDIINKLDAYISSESDACVIAGVGGHTDESIIIGTESAYLKLVRTLLNFVLSNLNENMKSQHSVVSCDEIQTTFYNAANWDCFINAAYLATDREHVLSLLKDVASWTDDLVDNTSNDPDFYPSN